MIARALAQEPEVILLDEPTSSLDIAHQIRTFDLIRSLSRSAGLTVVSVTHDMNLAALYCDRIALLEEGRLHSLGRPGEVITESHIREVYRVNVVVDHHPYNRTAEGFPSRQPFARSGKPVGIRRCPATVSGTKSAERHWSLEDREGAESRHEPRARIFDRRMKTPTFREEKKEEK